MNDNIQKAPMVPPFVRFVCSAVPMVFDDSLSYYEALCALWKWLQDDVVNVINNNATVTEEYIQLTKEMKEYMDNYFDNLDVQEEINNKLDQMAEDGTLQEIMADYIQVKVAWTFDNVSEMKTSTNLIDGSYAQTLGYYNVNDGGAAKYKIREIGSGESADEKFLVAIGSGTLVAELITDDVVNICQVGGQQNLDTVCNYVISAGKSVYIPDRDFTITSPIIINNDYTQFYCDGDIEQTTTDAAVLSIRSNRNVIKLNGNISSTDGVGVEICSGNHHVFDNDIFINTISSSTTGILINPDNGKGFQSSHLRFNRIISSDLGISIEGGNTGNPWVTSLTVDGGHITAPYSIKFRKGSNQTDRFNQIVFNDIVFSGTIQCAIDIQLCQSVWFNQCRMVEGMAGTYWVKLDDCGFVYLKNEGFLPVDKIQITSPMGTAYPCFLEGNMLTNSSLQAISTKAKTYKTDICMLEEPVTRYDGYISAYNTDTFNSIGYYYNGMIVEIGTTEENATKTIDLPEVFCNRGIVDFYIYLKNKPSTTSYKLRDNPHNTLLNLATGTALSNKRYHAKFVKYLDGNPQWIVTPLN